MSIASDGCPIEAVSQFYWRTTQITYDYQPVSADELLRHGSLVVRGRVVGIGPSVPVPQRYADDVEVALELEVSHVYRGSAQPNERLFVAIDRSEVVTDADLAARSRMIPAAEVTVFLQESASRPAARKGEQRVFSLISPQAMVVASSCGVATAFVEASPFAQPLANATELHEAMAAISDPCRSQCPLTTTEPCAEKPFESFATLAVTEQEWLATHCSVAEADEGASFPFFVEARCDDGKRVLYRGTGFTIERRYYESDGTFLGLETLGDGGQGPACHGSAYWPARVVCPSAVATRVHCGSGGFAVGDRVRLQD